MSNEGTMSVRAGIARLDAFISKCESLGVTHADMIRDIMDALISDRLTITLSEKSLSQSNKINEVFKK